MPATNRRYALGFDDKTAAKMKWVAIAKGWGPQAWMRRVILDALAKEPDPPEGYYLPRAEEDD